MNLHHLAIFPFSVTLLGLTGLVVNPAQALTLKTITYSAETGLLNTDLEGVPLASPTLIPQFDAMAIAAMHGSNLPVVLKRVVLSYYGDIEFSGSLTNTASSTDNFTVIVDAGASVDGPGDASDVDFDLIPGVIGSLLAITQIKNLAPGATAIIPTVSASGITTLPSNPITLTGDDLTPFIGNGTVNFFGNTAVGQLIRGGGGNTEVELTTLVNLGVDVTYEYEKVPEPLTILGASAAIGFGAAFKRKLAQSDK